MVKPINGRSAVGGNPCFKTAFYCLLNPCKSASLDQESLIPERLNRWKLLVWHLACYFQGWQLRHCSSSSMAVVDQKTKNIEHWMGNIEILGRPQYRSRKLQEEQEQNQATRKESKKRPSDTDLEYERDEKDWWWCDDVWLRDFRIKSGLLKRLWPSYSMTSQSSQVGTWFNASTTKKSCVSSLKRQWSLRSEMVAIGNDQTMSKLISNLRTANEQNCVITVQWTKAAL